MRIGQWRQGMKGPVEIGRPVDQDKWLGIFCVHGGRLLCVARRDRVEPLDQRLDRPGEVVLGRFLTFGKRGPRLVQPGDGRGGRNGFRGSRRPTFRA